MQNGMAALFSVSRDAGQAGWGLNDILINGCDTAFKDTGSTGEGGGFVLASAKRGTTDIWPLAAAVIVPGSSAGSSDSVSLYSGSSLSGTGSLRLVDDYTKGGTTVAVDRAPYGFALNDVIVVVPETAGSAKCSLAQISTDPSAQAAPPSTQRLVFANTAGMRYNSAPDVLGANYGNGTARLFNLGPAASLSFHTWSVTNGFLQLRATDMVGASLTPQAVSDNIVALKAEYGFDTRTGSAFDPTAGMQVTSWSPVMINADNVGEVGDAGDYQRIAAIRIGVVARSKNPEKPNAAGNCTATVATTMDMFTDAVPSGVAAVPVTVNLAVPGDPISSQCYHYRKFETIVPIRNSGWRPS
jgi:type IV pilus assembly protein PilW